MVLWRIKEGAGGYYGIMVHVINDQEGMGATTCWEHFFLGRGSIVLAEVIAHATRS
jgi:hypothetical protein